MGSRAYQQGVVIVTRTQVGRGDNDLLRSRKQLDQLPLRL
jgi:hypothetical protein